MGLLVALNAENNHKVTLFRAGEEIEILNCKKAGELVGQEIGDLYEHLENLKNSKVTIDVSESQPNQGVTMRNFYMDTKQSL